MKFLPDLIRFSLVAMQVSAELFRSSVEVWHAVAAEALRRDRQSAGRSLRAPISRLGTVQIIQDALHACQLGAYVAHVRQCTSGLCLQFAALGWLQLFPGGDQRFLAGVPCGGFLPAMRRLGATQK